MLYYNAKDIKKLVNKSSNSRYKFFVSERRSLLTEFTFKQDYVYLHFDNGKYLRMLIDVFVYIFDYADLIPYSMYVHYYKAEKVIL